METKLHLGCGTVYLKGWINVDLSNKLAVDNPDLVKHNMTTLNKYYKYPYGKPYQDIGNRPSGNDVVVDMNLDLSNVPYPIRNREVDEILAVSVLEHFSRHMASKLLREWYRILKPSGFLSIDVPDLIGTVKMFTKGSGVLSTPYQEYIISLIYGSQKNAYSFHKWGYTSQTLIYACRQAGFADAYTEHLIEHEYPMFTVKAVK